MEWLVAQIPVSVRDRMVGGLHWRLKFFVSVRDQIFVVSVRNQIHLVSSGDWDPWSQKETVEFGLQVRPREAQSRLETKFIWSQGAVSSGDQTGKFGLQFKFATNDFETGPFLVSIRSLKTD